MQNIDESQMKYIKGENQSQKAMYCAIPYLYSIWWWTSKPGVLQFTGSQRAGHDWATELIVFWKKPKVREELSGCQGESKKDLESDDADDESCMTTFTCKNSYCHAPKRANFTVCKFIIFW